MKLLIAIVLTATCVSATAKDKEDGDAAPKVAKPAAGSPAKKAPNTNIGRATAKPFFAEGAARNPFDVPLFRDARSFNDANAPRDRYVLR